MPVATTHGFTQTTCVTLVVLTVVLALNSGAGFWDLLHYITEKN